MRLPHEEGENYDLIFEEDKLLAIVGRIQSKIFDKTFSFNAKRIEGIILQIWPFLNFHSIEAEKKNLEETIYVAIDEAKKNKEGEIKEEDETTKAEKSTVKSGINEPSNGMSQKMEEEVSPKKKRKGEKKEVVRINSREILS